MTNCVSVCVCIVREIGWFEPSFCWKMDISNDVQNKLVDYFFNSELLFLCGNDGHYLYHPPLFVAATITFSNLYIHLH